MLPWQETETILQHHYEQLPAEEQEEFERCIDSLYTPEDTQAVLNKVKNYYREVKKVCYDARRTVEEYKRIDLQPLSFEELFEMLFKLKCFRKKLHGLEEKIRWYEIQYDIDEFYYPTKARQFMEVALEEIKPVYKKIRNSPLIKQFYKDEF